MRESKYYSLNNGYGIVCTTVTNVFTNEKSYIVEVLLLTVPWQEVLFRKEGIRTPKEANDLFKQLVSKYKQL